MVVGLIDGDGGQWPVCLLDGEVPSSEFLGNFRMCCQQFHHSSHAQESSACTWCDPGHGTILLVFSGQLCTSQMTLGAESAHTCGPSPPIAGQLPSSQTGDRSPLFAGTNCRTPAAN